MVACISINILGPIAPRAWEHPGSSMAGSQPDPARVPPEISTLCQISSDFRLTLCRSIIHKKSDTSKIYPKCQKYVPQAPAC